MAKRLTETQKEKITNLFTSGITLEELSKLVKKKYKDFDITSRQLGNILRDNNKTRKRTRHEHFPKIRYGTPVNKQNELNKFYKEIDKYPLNKIIDYLLEYDLNEKAN